MELARMCQCIPLDAACLHLASCCKCSTSQTEESSRRHQACHLPRARLGPLSRLESLQSSSTCAPFSTSAALLVAKTTACCKKSKGDCAALHASSEKAIYMGWLPCRGLQESMVKSKETCAISEISLGNGMQCYPAVAVKHTHFASARPPFRSHLHGGPRSLHKMCTLESNTLHTHTLLRDRGSIIDALLLDASSILAMVKETSMGQLTD